MLRLICSFPLYENDKKSEKSYRIITTENTDEMEAMLPTVLGIPCYLQKSIGMPFKYSQKLRKFVIGMIIWLEILFTVC